MVVAGELNPTLESLRGQDVTLYRLTRQRPKPRMSKDFTLDDVAFLTSERGDTLLSQLVAADLSERNLINLIPKLRPKYSADETSAAIEAAKLRRAAVDKFGDDAGKMLFTPDALQQASDPLVRRWRTGQMSGSVVDVCCSIGTDALAFARAGCDVVGVDIDPVRVAMARYNAAAVGVDVAFQVMDVTEQAPPPAETLFYDPARRDERGFRIYDVQRYIPPLSLMQDWTTDYDQLIAKLSPGVDIDQLADCDGCLSFVSVEGDLKEAQLTIGGDDVPRQAVRLTTDSAPAVYVSMSPSEPILDTPRMWLCEPDPAIIRAGYVAHLANDLGGTLLDPTIAYFTTDVEPDSTWARAWRVLDWMPFHLKRLRAALRERDAGPLTIKKRGSPILTKELHAKLKLDGDTPYTLVLTRLSGDPIVIICQDYQPSGTLSDE